MIYRFGAVIPQVSNLTRKEQNFNLGSGFVGMTAQFTLRISPDSSRFYSHSYPIHRNDFQVAQKRFCFAAFVWKRTPLNRSIAGYAISFEGIRLRKLSGQFLQENHLQGAVAHRFLIKNGFGCFNSGVISFTAYLQGIHKWVELQLSA